MGVCVKVALDQREDSVVILDHIRSSARRVDSSVTITGLLDSDDAPFAEVAAVSGAP